VADLPRVLRLGFFACKNNSEMVAKHYYDGITDNQTLPNGNLRKVYTS